MSQLKPELMSMNTATTKRQWNFPEAVDNYSRCGIRAMAPWRESVCAYGVDRAAKMLRDANISVSSYCRGGMFPYTTKKDRRVRIDDNLRAIEEAATLGAECLVIVAGGLPEGSIDLDRARECVADMLSEILPTARATGVPLAIEPLHPMYAADRCCINTMMQALDLCDRLGDGAGIALDIYHVWWDPMLKAAIERAGPEQLLSVHLCDWLRHTSDLLLDRGMMGDGVVDIRRIRRWLENIDYRGYYEIEIFSANNWWRREGEEVIQTCKERFLTSC